MSLEKVHRNLSANWNAKRKKDGKKKPPKTEHSGTLDNTKMCKKLLTCLIKCLEHFTLSASDENSCCFVPSPIIVGAFGF